MNYDTIVVGAGLAGACAALYLSRHERILVVDAAGAAAGASGAAAGLVNPLAGLRARPVWRMDEALAAFHETLEHAGAATLFRGTGVLRPARDDAQVAWFREAAVAHPRHARWLDAPAATAVHPGVAAPLGALLLPTAGAVDVAALCRALLAAAVREGAAVQTGTRVVGWEEASGHAAVRCAPGEVVTAGRIVLAMGDGFAAFPELAALHLHRVKGQTVRVRTPDGVAHEAAVGDLPHLAGRGYVVHEGETLVVGSTYEHDFTDARPSPEASRHLLDKASAMLPALRSAEVVDAQAGVRVNVPGTRLPVLGPLPGRRRVWIFTGLGSKGLLMAPLLACHLFSFFADPGAIPEDVRVRAKDGGRSP